MKKAMFNLSTSIFTLSQSLETAVSFFRFQFVCFGNHAEADKIEKKLSAKDAESKYTPAQIQGMKDSVAQYRQAALEADNEAGKLAVAKDDFVRTCCTPDAQGIQNDPKVVELYLRILAAGQDSKFKSYAFTDIQQELAAQAYTALNAACFAQTKQGKPMLSDDAFKSVQGKLNGIFVRHLSLPVAVKDTVNKCTLRANATDARAIYLTYVKSVKADIDDNGNLTGELRYNTAITAKTDKKSGETVYSCASFLNTLQEVILAKVANK